MIIDESFFNMLMAASPYIAATILIILIIKWVEEAPYKADLKYLVHKMANEYREKDAEKNTKNQQ